MTETDPKALAKQAWDLFRRGDFAGAEKAAVAVVQQAGWNISTPLPDLMILKSFHLLRLQKYDESFRLFGKVLEMFPDDSCAQEGFLLAMRGHLQGDKSTPANATRSGAGVLLLGLGTGRSGSTSLAKLWESQDDCYSFHEHPPRLTWKENPTRWSFHKRRFDLLLDHYGFVSDVSHWWLPYIDRIMEHYQNVRIVVLQRDRDAMVESFLKIKAGRDGRFINHWIDHDGSTWIKNAWDECYPSYDVSTMREALECYWNEYRSTVDALVKRFPSSIKVFPTERLSEPDTQRDILSFCGFENVKIADGLHLNQETASDGAQSYLR